ncbi:MAG: phage major capsid protein [Planctomycetota bacterium]|nr:phage major capsid protein [Planctomycetota bacterium]
MADEAEGVLFDNASTRTSLLYRLKALGSIIRTGGKPHLRFNILKELPTAQGYTDLDPLTPVRGDPATSCIYEWKQIAVPVQVSGLDMIKTPEGNEIDLVELFLQSAEIAMRESIGGSSEGIFSSADETNLRAITGLQNMLTTSTTTGTVGNLSRATLTKWRHQSGNVASAFTTNGLNIMRTLFRQATRYDETIDTIVLTGAAMDNFERALTSTFQVNLPLMGVGAGDQAMIDAGFGNISYKGALIFADDACPANFGYFLNAKKYFRLFVREGRDAEIGDFVKSQTKDDLATYVLWAGNAVMTNLGRNGTLLNADTWS